MSDQARADQDWGWATEYDDVSGAVAICGVGESDHTKASGRTVQEIVGSAVERAIADAGLEPSDVDGLMHIPLADQFDVAAFHDYFGTDHDMWESRSGGGMRWAATAPYEAAKALANGDATTILNTFGVAWATQRSSMVGGPGESHAQELFKQNLEIPMGWFPQPVYFATVARRHMHDFGTTQEDLGAVAVTCRRHANLTPAAVMHEKPLTMEQYLDAPTIVAPFRKEDCCLISDGGGAYLMTTPERARDLSKPVVEVAGVGLGNSATGVHWAQQEAFTSTPQVFAAPAAFEMAGLSPADVDVYTCYDPFTIVTLMQIEDSGFCEKGAAGEMARRGDLAYDSGVLPTNTHGGLLSHAYVLGIAHVVEVVRQLRGEAAAQVPDAQVGIYGGYTGPQASTLILRKG
jgi:acetyl-CoA acetyltransferase